jgi:hypothetical protein
MAILLQIAGAGLLLLAFVHIPIGRHLKWRDDAARMTPVNTSVFHVHTLFICLTLVMMGLPCLFDPWIFLERSRAGAWLAWSFAGFWALRLYCQWWVYPRDLWRGRRLETRIHFCFTILWLSLACLFALCGAHQSQWLRLT